MDLTQKLIEMGEKRKLRWERLAAKFENIDCDESFAVADLPPDFGDPSEVAANNSKSVNSPAQKPTAPSEKSPGRLGIKIPPKGSRYYNAALTTTIEKDLGSNMRELLQTRQISRVLYDDDMYKTANKHLKKEMRRVIEHVGKEHMLAYLALCARVEKDDKVWHLIEEVFESSLKDLLIKQEEAKTPQELFFWNAKVRKEWEDLKSVVTEEDVLTYAVVILKPYRSLSKTK